MNLSTTYLGLKLRTPLVASASPLSEALDKIKRLEDAGASAIVFHSLFEEQIRADAGGPSLAGATRTEALTYLPAGARFQVGVEKYLAHIAQARAAVNIPIIGSLNAVSFGGWTTYAKQIEQAGAHALELNFYSLQTDPDIPAEEIETEYVTILASAKGQLNIPIAVKLSPYFTNLARFARRLDDNGADGLVLFNRFYQPDIELETREVVPNTLLSTPGEMRLPLRWIAILRQRIGGSLAATSGIHCATDVLKLIMAGADATMLCSVLLARGVEHFGVIEAGVREWLEEHEHESLEELKARLSQANCPDPAAFERAHYLRAASTARDVSPSIPTHKLVPRGPS